MYHLLILIHTVKICKLLLPISFRPAFENQEYLLFAAKKNLYHQLLQNIRSRLDKNRCT